MAAAAMSAGAGIAGTAISSGAAIGMTAMQNSNNAAMQQAAFSYNDSVINRASDAFTQAGLPRYLAFTAGDTGTMPSQRYSLGGSNFYTGQMNMGGLQTQHSPMAQMLHLGTVSYNPKAPKSGVVARPNSVQVNLPGTSAGSA